VKLDVADRGKKKEVRSCGDISLLDDYLCPELAKRREEVPNPSAHYVAD